MRRTKESEEMDPEIQCVPSITSVKIMFLAFLFSCTRSKISLMIVQHMFAHKQPTIGWRFVKGDGAFLSALL